MKDNTESRGGNTGTQGTTGSSTQSSTQKGSQSSNQGSVNRQGANPARPDQEMNQPGKGGRTGTQQSGSSGGQGSHADSTGTGSGQISPQTHDTSNRGNEDHGDAGPVTGRNPATGRAPER